MKSWLIFGASGLLGAALAPRLVNRGRTVLGVRHGHQPDLPGVTWRTSDLLMPGACAHLVRETKPDVVIYAAGLTNVDACEQDEARAHRLHCGAAEECLGAAAAAGRKTVYISTDHLWRGNHPMVEEATPCDPQNAYARTKLAGEQAVFSAAPDTLVIRTNFFGPGLPWRQSLSDWVMHELAAGRAINAFIDAFFTPIETHLLSDIIVTLTEKGATGIFHVAGGSRISKHQFALLLADAFDLPKHLIKSTSISGHAFLAPRPRDMSLATGKLAAFLGAPPPDIDTCIRALADAAPARNTR